MAVTQYFTIDLPGDGIPVGDATGNAVYQMTLSREDAESLCADLDKALHPGGVPSPENATQDLLATFLASLQATQDEVYEPDAPVGPPMSPDEALARVQATAASQSVPTGPPVRNPGTGIGNG